MEPEEIKPVEEVVAEEVVATTETPVEPEVEAASSYSEAKPVGPATIAGDAPIELFPQHDETISSQ